MKLYFVLLFCFLYHILFSQQACKGVLLDSATKQGIEFANIGIIGKGVGTVSNEKGEYSFSFPDSLLNEQVRVSIIGYEPKVFLLSDLRKRSVILLSQSAILLKETGISVNKTKVKIVGN